MAGPKPREQARGETLDPRADLFRFGSVLYTMCSGRPPFRAPNLMAVLKRAVANESEIDDELKALFAALGP